MRVQERSEVLDALETTPPRWTGAVVVLLVAGLAVRGARGADLPVACAWVAALAIFASVLVLGGGKRVADLALALAPAVAAAAAGVSAFGLASTLSPFEAHEPGGRVMLALRVFVYALASFRVPVRDGRAMVATAILGAGFVASLVAHGLVVALVVGVAIVVRRFAIPLAGERRMPSTRRAVAALALVSALAFAASFARSPLPPARNAHQQVDDWLARDNPFRARAEALEWAKHEDPPGEGHLALASIDWRLGHVEAARRVLSKVLARPASEDVMRRAGELSRAWGGGSP
jgi:hypothetical protein